ncbi:MAG: maleylacetate reductase [Gammaproteobacteria bacterium]|nr:maleylacetate reductase [Gammaproteobacteria bacterium]
MLSFDYQALPWNIVFGVGSLQRLPEELAKLGYRRAMVLTTPRRGEQGQKIVELLAEHAVSLFDRAVMHVPVATVEQAIAEMDRTGADCSVSLGGGSTTGLGKALALKKQLPNIVIPTTYAGSEMTNIWGMTEHGRKLTGRDNAVVPKLTIYDPELTLGLPPRIAGPSGLNAMAQAAVNVTAAKINPMVSMMALEAVRLLSRSLPKIINNPQDLEARSEALFGASLAGASLGTGVTSLHHRLCHTFGGSFNTPHAETHTILLPHSIAYNALATSEGTRQLASAMGVKDAAVGLFELAKAVGAPTSLKEIGFREEDLDRAAAIATEKPLNNPEPVTEASIRRLLEDAYMGFEPSSF